MSGPLRCLQGPLVPSALPRSPGSSLLMTTSSRQRFQLGLGNICTARLSNPQQHSRLHPARTVRAVDQPSRKQCSSNSSLVCQAQAGASSSSEDAVEGKKDNFLARLLRPLRDFGFGRSSIWEGGVGLFILAAIGDYQLHVVAQVSYPGLPRSRFNRQDDD